MTDDELYALAKRAGLQPDWIDAHNQPRRVSPDTLQHVLNAMVVSQDFPEPDMHRDDAPSEIARCITIEDVAPGRRIAGLAAQLYSLRGGTSPGYGDLAALGEIASQAAAQNIEAMAVSPLHALLPGTTSFAPYSPSSRCFIDPIHAALDTMAVDDGSALIDWNSALPAKHAQLRAAYAQFDKAPPPDEFVRYVADRGIELTRHAQFQALSDYFLKQGLTRWRDWPLAYQDPSNAAVVSFAREHDDDIRYAQFTCWIAERSLAQAQKKARDAGMAVGLIADIAVGMHPDGSDVWAFPHESLQGVAIGAPPDVFNTTGQDWGVTAFSPVALRETNYRGFVEMLRGGMRHAGGIRIDHVMGLTRLWLVPQGAPPDQGVYLHYPLQEMLACVARESQAFRAIVIGEDLGTVPDGLRDTLRQAGIYGMEVLWFQRQYEYFVRPDRWLPSAVAMTTTHDLPTVMGWSAGRDIDWLETLHRKAEQGSIAEERAARERDKVDLTNAFIDAGCNVPGDPVESAAGFIAKTPCQLALLPLEDVFEVVEQPNIPGTIDEHPNWRRRLPAGQTLEDARPKENIRALTQGRTRA
jgi:4-alpha-glucanotransferase